MIKSMSLKLLGGEFEVIHGTEFSVSSDCINHLVYEKDGVWYAESDPVVGKYGHTVITVPTGRFYDKISIEMTDGTLQMCKIYSHIVSINVNRAVFDAGLITGTEMGVMSINSNTRIKADMALSVIDCGYGTVNIGFMPYKYGYKIKSKCGMGEVTHNTSVLPKHYTSSDGERLVKVICGMGNVNINT